MIIRDPGGKPYTVRYDAVNAMLLNEFLKEHRKVEQQDRGLEQQEASKGKKQAAGYGLFDDILQPNYSWAGVLH